MSMKWHKGRTVSELDLTLPTTYGIVFKAAISQHAEKICRLVEAHQSAVSYLPDGDFMLAIHVACLSEKYKKYESYDVMPNGDGIWSCVARTNRPMRLTEEQLKAHSRFQAFSDLKDARGLEHPPMVGWLAVPVKRPNGDFIGLVQATDKVHGDFSQADEDRLVDYASAVASEFEGYYRKTAHLRD